MDTWYIECKTMIEQLRYAVERFNGKTTLTEEDIRRMEFMLRQLKRYDDMQKR